jgi:hypothetical protein
VCLVSNTLSALNILAHGAVRGSGQGLFPSRLCSPLISRGVMAIGAKPNLYCEAKELVCGGSPIGCVLVDVERKAQDRVKLEG